MAKIAKISGDYRWEVLTFAKSIGHFTRCFGGQVHQVLYLCSREPRGTSGTFPGMDRVLFHIQVRTLYAKDIFKEKHLTKVKKSWNRFCGHLSLYVNMFENGEHKTQREKRAMVN